MKRKTLTKAASILALTLLFILSCSNPFFPEKKEKGGDTTPVGAQQLEELIDEAETVLESVTVSKDGSDVPEGEYWVTQKDLEALEDAIKAAKEAIANGDDLNDVYDALEEAIKNFEKAKEPGEKPVVNDPDCECNGDCDITDCDCDHCNGGNNDDPCECCGDDCDCLDCDDGGCTDCIPDPCEGGHDLNKTNLIAATCEAAGNPDYWTCSVCDKFFADENGTSELSAEQIVIAALEHDLVDTTVETAATCAAEGVMNTKCDREGCTHTGTRAIPVDDTAHDFGVGIVTNATTYPAIATVICDDCGAPGTRDAAIGDTGPGGGRIYHVADGLGTRTLGFTVEGTSAGSSGVWPDSYTAYYLEAAPADSGAARWGGDDDLVAGVTTFTQREHEDADKIGNGRKDTQLIAAHMSGMDIYDTAAQLADQPQNGESDWFLPSLGELNLLYVNRESAGMPSNASYPFWSSTQSGDSSAWSQYFNPAGSRSSDGKGMTWYWVRAVRAF